MRQGTILFWVLVVAVPLAWYLHHRAAKGGRPVVPAMTSDVTAPTAQPPVAASARQKSASEQELHSLAGEGVLLLKQFKADQALAVFDRALSELDKLESHPADLEQSLHFHRGRALEQLKRSDEALAEYRTCQSDKYLNRMNPWPQLAAFHQGKLLITLGQPQEGVNLLRTVLERRPHLPVSMQLETYHLLASTLHSSGDHLQGLSMAEKGTALAERTRQPISQARMLRASARCQMALGRHEDALVNLQCALDLYRLASHAGGQVDTKREIGRLYQATGDWLKAFSWLRACLEDEEAVEDRGAEARLCYDIACLSIDQGSLVEAGMFLQRSLALFRQIEDRDGIDEAGRTMMGLTVLIHRLATADQITFRDIERGVKSSDPGKE